MSTTVSPTTTPASGEYEVKVDGYVVGLVSKLGRYGWTVESRFEQSGRAFPTRKAAVEALVRGATR